MKKKLLAFLLAIIAVSTVSLAVIADDSCQHKYVYNNIEKGTIYYTCIKCNDITTKSIIDVKDMWNNELLNTNDDNSFIDLVPDGIINAKDYVKLRIEYENYRNTPTLDIGGEI